MKNNYFYGGLRGNEIWERREGVKRTDCNGNISSKKVFYKLSIETLKGKRPKRQGRKGR